MPAKTAKKPAARKPHASVTELRKAFAALRSNASYCVSRQEWTTSVTLLAGSIAKNARRKKPTPKMWVEAAEQAVTMCDACNATGVYRWGGSTNGKSAHSGPCFRCESKGYQNQADYRRNRFYDMHRKVSIT
jgi:hypothetical protein